jgi:hypothetical protein
VPGHGGEPGALERGEQFIEGGESPGPGLLAGARFVIEPGRAVGVDREVAAAHGSPGFCGLPTL